MKCMDSTPFGDRSKFLIQDVGVKNPKPLEQQKIRMYLGSSKCVKSVPVSPKKTYQKGRKFTYLEDRGMSCFDTC